MQVGWLVGWLSDWVDSSAGGEEVCGLYVHTYFCIGG